MAYTGNDPYTKVFYEKLKKAGFDDQDIELIIYIEEKRQAVEHNMRHWGYVIAVSDKIPDEEKDDLIAAVRDFAMSDKPFSIRQRSLLYRIRNERWIRNSCLYDEAQPESFLDRLLNY